ncbi:hypothetical protein DPMN_079017 [Dreissena polymorpha]|uniref:Uncharacterized protein n=1 Tax=Dreissena polymorpha TaxID=45954 RepID=A0A9D4BI09_DREPO|nr:hypothetical protein DPMN_079017 [Dreissena polymorpha]
MNLTNFVECTYRCFVDLTECRSPAGFKFAPMLDGVYGFRFLSEVGLDECRSSAGFKLAPMLDGVYGFRILSVVGLVKI